MKTKLLALATAFFAVLLAESRQNAAEEAVIYQQDFSSNPNWVTDQPNNFMWLPDEGVFFARMENAFPDYEPNRYAYVITKLDPTKSFTLKWHQFNIDLATFGHLSFGLYSSVLANSINYITDYEELWTNTGSTFNISYSGSGKVGAHFFKVMGRDSWGHSITYAGKETRFIGKWLLNQISYDSVAETVSFSISEIDTGIDIVKWESMRGTSFLTNMVYLGMSQYPIGQITNDIYSLYPQDTALCKIDNIILTQMLPEPAPELPDDVKEIIETQPELPTYGEVPLKLPGKDSLVVVTHGWNPDITWVVAMTNAINNYLIAQNLDNWQVHAHMWERYARGVNPQNAIDKGELHGNIVGKCLALQNWSHIHLIAHSAGAALIQAATDVIKGDPENTTIIHQTFLDAFVGFDEAGITHYGRGADWVDNYFARDLFTGGNIWPFTQGLLDNGFNVDVTWIDENKRLGTKYIDGELCTYTESSHSWPIEFYMRTIPPSSFPKAAGFGFPLSKEASGWEFALANYNKRGGLAKVLGEVDDPRCTQLYETTPAVIGPIMDLGAQPFVTSPFGTFQIFNNTELEINTGSPAWFVTFVTPTNNVNVVSFGMEFLSDDAEGLLTTYWNTNALGSIDEKATLSGLRQYTFSFPKAEAKTTHTLGFRLDAFSEIQSSARIVNVVLGTHGIVESFELRFTEETQDGQAIIELIGPAGFQYVVEMSTNLIDWQATAVLVNTTGTVKFTDQSTGTATRFYRAVAGY